MTKIVHIIQALPPPQGKNWDTGLSEFSCDLFRFIPDLQDRAGEEAKANWPPHYCATK